jgi:hypothetical protein
MKKILITRDSVSQGDDAHQNLEIEIHEDWKFGEILSKVLNTGYLPKIFGGKATWCVAYHQPIAVIAQEWTEPKFMGLEYYSLNGKNKDFNRLHFSYFAQRDPNLVYEILWNFKTVYYIDN